MVNGVLARERTEVGALVRADADLRARSVTAESVLAPHEATARRANAALALLDEHTAWARAFQTLEERTLPSVTYANLTADTAGAMVVSVAAPDIRIAAEQIAVLQATPGISAFDVGGIASVVDEVGVTRGVQFTLRFRFDPDMFQANRP